ncbi:MAG: adenine deaminase [Schwartzia sp. (in: firmicutes)]
MIEDLARFTAVAQGKTPAELVIRGAKIYQSFTGTFFDGDIAIDQGYIAGLGAYSGIETISAEGRYALPGFIDGHLHIESSLLSPREFARAVVPTGTTAVVTDPHEIANVAGILGIRYMMDASRHLPLDTFFMLPSCVPATDLEDGGAHLSAKELAPLLEEPRVLGLAEMMNVPGVLSGDPAVYEKLTMRRDLQVEGHAPGLLGKSLMGYAAAGISSDHECATEEEGWARLSAGMYLEIREGSAAHNLAALRPLINERTAPFCFFVTDDRHPADLLVRGHINSVVKSAVEAGVPLWAAINMATVNPARYFGLRERGVIAPHHIADILLFDGDGSWQPAFVVKSGVLAAREGRLLLGLPKTEDTALCDTIHIAPVEKADLAIPLPSGRAHVIGLVPGQLLTEKLTLSVRTEEGCAVADPERDIVKLAVVERHHATGRIGLGLLTGYGLKHGAVASTVGHDSHNLIVAGVEDDDMVTAIEEIQRIGGGFVIVRAGEVLASLPLPIGGLMTARNARVVAMENTRLIHTARQLGVSADCEPLMTLAFLSLPVIPALKLTDRGLVDVTAGQFLPVDAEAAR